jgi:Bax protein|tara:strand:- start:847 stop:1563 length:717 start_codon:yes stop_codon:yes gene_type:complete
MAKFNWEKLLHTTWFYTKVFFAILALMTATYYWGTYNPNKKAVKQANQELEIFYIQKIKDMELREPEFVYSNDIQFVRAMHKCIDYINFSLPRLDRVPYEMIVAQAALETGWGTSRFAVEGNNLFGIRTWDKNTPHMVPLGMGKKWPGWGVRIFASKCGSVKEYIRLLNEHPAYEDFRKARTNFHVKNLEPDPLILIQNIDKFSTTADYDKRVKRIIVKVRKLEEKYASDKTINGDNK